MDPAARQLFEDLGIALLLGLLVGLQRERRSQLLAGLRTFPLITVLGTLAAVIDAAHEAGGWIVVAGFLAVAAAAVTTNALQIRGDTPDYGMTTVMAILLMYAVGAYLPGGHRAVAIAVGGGVAVLLEFKGELHGIAGRLGDEDLRAIMTFVLITCIVLPILPNQTYDAPTPLNVLNPFEIWMMVVLIVGISLGGYLAYKFFGRSAGVLLAGLLGGAISSTATTATFARRTKTAPESARLALVAILVASAVAYLRVLLEIGVVAPSLFLQLAPPIAVPMACCLLVALLVWRQVQGNSDEMPEQKNPTELRSAIVFGLIYAGVLMALAAARTWFGGQGLYLVAILSGLTDMDAITLSTARMATADADHGIAPSDAWRLILVASLANLVFKGAIAAALGHATLAWRIAAWLAVPLISGGVVLLMWPA
jgi:uncharacterized membrane protein (DUF4010 family)